MKFKVGQKIKTITGYQGTIVFIDKEDLYNPYLLCRIKNLDSHRAKTIWYLLDCDHEDEETIEPYRKNLPKGFTLEDEIYSRWVSDEEAVPDRKEGLELI